ncbi:hypothetical protein BDZ90DRAFT_21065 [Jaminaea rosea]|uniref:Uncharacterized protein n=1 Tax=Jaminaea rosea TaxID=1569628 RepID=A0A316UZI0_9BASI|nr:hypothetical protein BDZ90DRAFT_21065 [Jaminaea rosea]PWN30696.1 hypothetical protein BDZ90DRAFT_21065 [Jaminaea rosea]
MAASKRSWSESFMSASRLSEASRKAGISRMAPARSWRPLSVSPFPHFVGRIVLTSFGYRGRETEAAATEWTDAVWESNCGSQGTVLDPSGMTSCRGSPPRPEMCTQARAWTSGLGGAATEWNIAEYLYRCIKSLGLLKNQNQHLSRTSQEPPEPRHHATHSYFHGRRVRNPLPPHEWSCAWSSHRRMLPGCFVHTVHRCWRLLLRQQPYSTPIRCVVN